MFIVCICTRSCRKLVKYIPATQMKLPRSKKPCVLNRQADKHALLIKSCLAAFQEKPISRWVFGFFLFETNVFCLAFKLILLELHLSRLTALTVALCLQRLRRHSHIHIIWHYGKKNIYSSGDCHFHNKCLWWHFAVCITWSVRGCLTDTAQIPSKSTHPLLLYVFLSSNTLF